MCTRGNVCHIVALIMVVVFPQLAYGEISQTGSLNGTYGQNVIVQLSDDTAYYPEADTLKPFRAILHSWDAEAISNQLMIDHPDSEYASTFDDGDTYYYWDWGEGRLNANTMGGIYYVREEKKELMDLISLSRDPSSDDLPGDFMADANELSFLTTEDAVMQAIGKYRSTTQVNLGEGFSLSVMSYSLEKEQIDKWVRANPVLQREFNAVEFTSTDECYVIDAKLRLNDVQLFDRQYTMNNGSIINGTGFRCVIDTVGVLRFESIGVFYDFAGAIDGEYSIIPPKTILIQYGEEMSEILSSEPFTVTELQLFYVLTPVDAHGNYELRPAWFIGEDGLFDIATWRIYDAITGQRLGEA